jgi:hypothetical protein
MALASDGARQMSTASSAMRTSRGPMIKPAGPMVKTPPIIDRNSDERGQLELAEPRKYGAQDIVHDGDHSDATRKEDRGARYAIIAITPCTNAVSPTPMMRPRPVRRYAPSFDRVPRNP